MAVLIYITLGFLLLRTGVSLYNLFSFPYLKNANKHAEEPLISVLIPARNEAGNILSLLQSLRAQNYSNLEVFILDDHSEDDTYAVTENFIKNDPRFHVRKGEELPEGWLGKNFACHQLSQNGNGEYFLFLDADVTLAPNAIPSALAEMQSKKLSLLSLFPDQEMYHFSEKIIVPVMHYLLLSLLPLRLIFKSKNPAFAAANGQFMFFDAKVYKQNNFHKLFYNTVIEDIAIIKYMKNKNMAVETLLGNKLVKCRMYNSFNEAVEGFSKNLFAGFNNNIALMSFYFFFVFFSYFIIIGHMSLVLIFLAFTLIVLMRMSIALMANQHVFEQLLLHPLQMCMLLYLALLSYFRKKKKQLTWKGRVLDI